MAQEKRMEALAKIRQATVELIYLHLSNGGKYAQSEGVYALLNTLQQLDQAKIELEAFLKRQGLM